MRMGPFILGLSAQAVPCLLLTFLIGLIRLLQVEQFVQTGFWKVCQAVAKAVTNRTEWYPYDVALNIVRSGDYTRIHKDCDGNEEVNCCHKLS